MQTVKLIWIVMVERHDAVMVSEVLLILLLPVVELVVQQVRQNVEFVRCTNQLKIPIQFLISLPLSRNYLTSWNRSPRYFQIPNTCFE